MLENQESQKHLVYPSPQFHTVSRSSSAFFHLVEMDTDADPVPDPPE
jgi:hypothetical protein